MATKTTFSPDEWQTLQWSVTDTMAYITMADPGFWDMFKEASAAAHFLAGVKTHNDNPLMRELAGDVKMHRDHSVSGDPADMAGSVSARVHEAAGIMAAKAPEDLEAFKAFLLGVAEATAEAAKGVDAREHDAIAHIQAALG